MKKHDFRQFVMQDVFNWYLTTTGLDEMTYEGEYMGCRVSMLIETTRRGGHKQHYQFAKRGKHKGKRKGTRYSTAKELFDSFPKLTIASAD